MKRNILIAALAATVLAGGGTAAAVAAAGDGGAAGDAPSRPGAAAGEGSEDSGRSGDDDRERAGAARTTVAEAVRAALEARAGTAASAELDDEDDRPIWEIEVLDRKGTWYEVRVDAGSGKVTGVAEDDGDGDEDGAGGDRGERESLRRAATDLGGAAGTAVKQTPGTVTSVEFEGRDDHGDTGRAGGWEVEILGKDGTEREVRVDAETGKATGAGAAAQDSGDDRDGRDGREDRDGDDRESGKDDDRNGRDDDKHHDREDDDRDDSRSDG
ncbi:PepSY domain-containing protein [Streptomyces xinghaiensis]|uniref:PepSY domain-containing protein n=1 Tax=Streptomyces xinghaiensis TaxID=1038928 RepID=UPI002E0EE041|nr:PepSY domain-containing protein [Streptomyces xinghaiensis]